MRHYYDSKGKPGYKRLTSVVIGGVRIRLYAMEGVFSSRGVDEGTRLLLENIILPETGSILDMGCGSGIIGIFVLIKNPSLQAVFVDVNPSAVKLARMNAKLNSVSNRSRFIVSNVYAELGEEKFSAIYTNPPLSAGWSTIEKIIADAPSYLVERGWLQAVLYKGEEKALRIARESFSEARVLKRKKGYSILLFRV